MKEGPEREFRADLEIFCFQFNMKDETRYYRTDLFNESKYVVFTRHTDPAALLLRCECDCEFNRDSILPTYMMVILTRFMTHDMSH